MNSGEHPPVQSDHWWVDYDRYLQSPIWAEKRRRVFERSRGLCEGCGIRRPDTVHHLRYPRGASPGSEAWIRSEKLFDLVALCSRCHADLHPSKDVLPLSSFAG
jgi:5-methylcytosine-specific restriction endonuclease McrA